MNQHIATQACRTCKVEKPLSCFWRQAVKKSGYQTECKDCMRSRNNRWHRAHPGHNSEVWRKLRQRDQKASLLRGAKWRSRKAGIEFSITVDDFEVPSHCPILGIELVGKYGLGKGNHARENSPSLDRIDPSLGYVPGNVVVVSWRANRIKSDATLEELRQIVRFYDQISK